MFCLSVFCVCWCCVCYCCCGGWKVNRSRAVNVGCFCSLSLLSRNAVVYIFVDGVFILAAHCCCSIGLSKHESVINSYEVEQYLEIFIVRVAERTRSPLMRSARCRCVFPPVPVPVPVSSPPHQIREVYRAHVRQAGEPSWGGNRDVPPRKGARGAGMLEGGYPAHSKGRGWLLETFWRIYRYSCGGFMLAPVMLFVLLVVLCCMIGRPW